MKTAWSGLLIGLSTMSAAAVNCEVVSFQGEQKGRFDTRGKACFILPESGENYVQAGLSGVTDARLLDSDNRRIRTLVEGGPADGTHSLLFSLPGDQLSTLIIQGEEGRKWHFRWQINATRPLKSNIKSPAPVSPKLQQLAKKVAAGGSTEGFWRERQREGTPMVEPVDAQHKRVTFLWRGARQNVFLHGSPAGEHDPLYRLGSTDVWFHSYVVPADTIMQYQLAPDVPQIAGTPHGQRMAILVSAQADPLNPGTLTPYRDRWNRYSLVALSPSRYCTLDRMKKPVQYGTLTRHQLPSTFLGNSREIKIYRPRMPQPARWTLLLFDGKQYQDEYHFANVLDNLIARRILPPVNVVFIDSLDHARRSQELPPNSHFADFMAHELVPWLQGQGLNMQRKKTVLAGSSYGGLAASWVALRYPRLAGNVLSLSGSWWWAPKGEKAGWLLRQYAALPRYPVRFWLQAGSFENAGPGGGNFVNTLRFEQVLRDKGYSVSFHPSSGGHDYAGWCEALVAGMRDFTGLTRRGWKRQAGEKSQQ